MRLITVDRGRLIRLASVLLIVGCAACSRSDSLPRNMSLTAFNPHREAFECKHEADVVPRIDPEADRWNTRAIALTSSLLWPNQRDYRGAVELWAKAAERKHWKAMLNLANAYARGEGVDGDSEHAVQIAEQAMKLGIPAAYDLMGTYYMDGMGVKQDASRAYAFWQLAADMGSPNAMAYLGGKMDAIYDDPKAGFWDNRKIALQMLECGYAQGSGDAAYALGTTLVGADKSLGEDNDRALKILHDGVKYGSAKSAGYLFGAFDDGDPVVGNVKDRARAERYSVLADRLERDPDLRLPNLDKVVPLPPAKLPKWDGNKATLIDAAKPTLPISDTLPVSSGHRIDRAHTQE
ncbi:sel1 repeat family protein [Burkholderia sp. Bp9090]|uniref:SEL1-like repeat protein n=1 Tax=Burkholderia sp. Bp9090 TaxID=2184567 RepID=UPI0021AB9739|nr:sel1 repeat family protein [Burkholderia sp. Bp9090]